MRDGGRWVLLVSMLVGAGCVDEAMLSPDGGPQPDADVMPDAQVCLPRAVIPLTITAGAFPPSPDHPSVVVVAPQGFDPAAPTELVVYVHGFNNCVENIVGETSTACTTGGPLRNAYSLAKQLEESGRNALLICPEVAFDQASGNAGKLATAGGLKAMLAETLAALPAPLGPIDLARHEKLIVATHSGGYVAAAAMATIGDVPVDELWLFDSLYGRTSSFDSWVMEDIESFETSMPVRRFANVYTSGGGTFANSQAMADRAAGWTSNDPSMLLDDRTTATLTPAEFQHGLLFKLSGLSHDDVPRTYFARLLASSSLSERTCP